MTYQIATSTKDSRFYVVATMNAGRTIVRILNRFDNRADAERLLFDLAA